jgi:catechol 2,3-dioxygenase-like lactoylglutathione lyase family enzyme
LSKNIRKIIETGIYSSDLEKSEKFYTEVLGLELVGKERDRHVFLAAGRSMLLIFNSGKTMKGKGGIPPHGGTGPSHFALEIESEDYDWWKRRLQDFSIAIESEISWGSGAKSIYFRDIDNHSVELITKSNWPIKD